jgi:uncharacterized protein (DUF433 family)
MTRLDQIAHSDPDILGRTPVFIGTRVPLRSLFDYLEGGDSPHEFLRQFPSVRREQAIAALDLLRRSEFKAHLLGGPKTDDFTIERERDTGRDIEL